MARLDELINQTARETGLDPSMLRAFVQIESGGNPRARTGSYSGLLQLSEDEFNKYGGGDILSPEDNLRAGAAKLAAERNAFIQKYGRDPTPTDLYLQHQQGKAGYEAHMGNPSGTAWENVRPYYTDEAARRKGFANGDEYAKAAIWGNVPDDVKAKFGSVDNVKSGDFVNLWQGKVARFSGDEAPQYAAADMSAASSQGKGKPMEFLAMLGKMFGAGPKTPMMPSASSPAGGAMAASGAGGVGMGSSAGSGMDNLFGSMASFGGQGQSSDEAMAQNAMKNAMTPMGNNQGQTFRPQFDAQKLNTLLQQAGRLGAYRPRSM